MLLVRTKIEQVKLQGLARLTCSDMGPMAHRAATAIASVYLEESVKAAAAARPSGRRNLKARFCATSATCQCKSKMNVCQNVAEAAVYGY